MRLRTAAATVFASAILLVGAAGTASAGEVDGNGQPTGAVGNARSICMYSGLDDGSEGGTGGPGNPPQNWGQIPKEVRDDHRPGRESILATPATVTPVSSPEAAATRPKPKLPVRWAGSFAVYSITPRHDGVQMITPGLDRVNELITERDGTQRLGVSEPGTPGSVPSGDRECGRTGPPPPHER